MKNSIARPKHSHRVKSFVVGASALALLIGISAHATNYTVKTDGSGNYATIQACANVAVAGDACTVYAGTYNETPNLITSGTSNNPITFTANAGDVVNVYGFILDGNYVTVNGFYITDPSLSHAAYGVDIPHSHTGDRITNNTIVQVGSGPCIMTHGSALSSYVNITGNTISWCGAVAGQSNASVATGIEANGDHFLIQNNNISHTTNGISGTEDHTVIRNNTWGPVNDATDFPGCHEAASCDTHADFVEVAASSSANGYILVERNNENNIFGVGGAHFYIVNSTGTTAIDRFNTQYNVGTGYLGNNGSSANFSNWKEYNNTMVSNQVQQASSGGGVSTWVSAPNGAFINNLIYNDVYPAGTKSGYYFVDTASSSGFVSRNNLAYDTSCTASTLSGCTSTPFSTATSSIYADPLFVSTNGNNFSVQSGSPATAGGTYLTTVSGSDSGTGTSLVVNDANFFQDGWNITGVFPDCISVTAVGNHVCITSINYATNTLTLSGSMQRTAGDPVWLYSDSTGRRVLLGIAPTIGAPPSPSPPQGLWGTVQ